MESAEQVGEMELLQAKLDLETAQKEALQKRLAEAEAKIASGVSPKPPSGRGPQRSGPRRRKQKGGSKRRRRRGASAARKAMRAREKKLRALVHDYDVSEEMAALIKRPKNRPT